jgi:hypothetical protein
MRAIIVAEINRSTRTAVDVRDVLLDRALTLAEALLPEVSGPPPPGTPDPAAFAEAVLARADEFLTPTLPAHASPTAETIGPSPTSVGATKDVTEWRADLFAASIRYSVQRILRGEDSVSPLTVAAIIDVVAVRLLGDEPLSHEQLLGYLPIAAEVMRRLLRAQAEDELAGHPVAHIGEVANAGSHIRYAQTAAGAIARDEWWQRQHDRDPTIARVFALHYFAGRSLPAITKLLALNRDEIADVRAELLLAERAVTVAIK